MRRFLFIVGVVLIAIWVYVFAAFWIHDNFTSDWADYFCTPAFYLLVFSAGFLRSCLPQWAVSHIYGICIDLPMLSPWGTVLVYLVPGVLFTAGSIYFRSRFRKAHVDRERREES